MFPPSNNQLRTSSTPRNHATIQDGRVTVQQTQGRQTQSFTSTGNRGIATTLKGNYAATQPRVVKCSNCQGEGHMDGSVIAKKHDLISVIDDEETLILEEESRSKMLDKQNDPISIKHKINISPIDYSKLNNIKEDFGKHFLTKKELSAEQAFWLKHSNHTFDTSVESHTPVRIAAPSELPKVSLVNESLKKLKYHLASFDNVVKKRTTSDAITV
ncbi:hypothetical protein Tco_1321409, partial [Tanacetum coccineum]